MPRPKKGSRDPVIEEMRKRLPPKKKAEGTLAERTRGFFAGTKPKSRAEMDTETKAAIQAEFPAKAAPKSPRAQTKPMPEKKRGRKAPTPTPSSVPLSPPEPKGEMTVLYNEKAATPTPKKKAAPKAAPAPRSPSLDDSWRFDDPEPRKPVIPKRKTQAGPGMRKSTGVSGVSGSAGMKSKSPAPIPTPPQPKHGRGWRHQLDIPLDVTPVAPPKPKKKPRRGSGGAM